MVPVLPNVTNCPFITNSVYYTFNTTNREKTDQQIRAENEGVIKKLDLCSCICNTSIINTENGFLGEYIRTTKFPQLET